MWRQISRWAGRRLESTRIVSVVDSTTAISALCVRSASIGLVAARAVRIDAAVRAVFVHLADPEQEWIVEYVDDALARHNWLVAERFAPSILVIRELECVVRAVLDHHGTVEFRGENNSRVCRRRFILVVVFREACQALGGSAAVNLSVVFLLVAMQEAHFPPLLAGEQVCRFRHRVALRRRHVSLLRSNCTRNFYLSHEEG
jgi:hypothetical protein